MAIKGSLKEASLADVCQLLALGNKTGCLSVTDRAHFGEIFFERGRITFSRIINRRDRIGDLLMREGALTQAQLAAALEVQGERPDKKLGQILVDQGVISQEDRSRFVRTQIEEAIYHLFTWSRGSFFFEADQVPVDADILVSINPDSLLLEAARRVDEWSLIEKKVPSFDLIFEVDAARAQYTYSDLTIEQKRMLPLLDGKRTLGEIVEETGLTEFEAGKALYGLLQGGLVTRIGQREAGRVRGRESELAERRNLGTAFYRTAMLEDAAREFKRVLELDADDKQARFFLALVTMREHRYKDALRLFKSLLDESGPQFGAFLNMALALRLLERPGDALLVLNEAEYIKPDKAVVALARGAAQLEAGKVDQARASFEEYRRRLSPAEHPSDRYFYYAALAEALAKRLNEAEELVNEGIMQHGTIAPLMQLAGLIAERKADYTKAEKWFRQVIEEDPTIVQAYKSLGDVFYRRGQHEEALVQYQRALQFDPDLGDDVYAKLGNIHYRMRAREEAIHLWSRALELNPHNQVVRNNIEIVLEAS